MTLEHNQSVSLTFKSSFSDVFAKSGRVSKYAKVPVPTITVKVKLYSWNNITACKNH